MRQADAKMDIWHQGLVKQVSQWQSVVQGWRGTGSNGDCWYTRLSPTLGNKDGNKTRWHSKECILQACRIKIDTVFISPQQVMCASEVGHNHDMFPLPKFNQVLYGLWSPYSPNFTKSHPQSIVILLNNEQTNTGKTLPQPVADVITN